MSLNARETQIHQKNRAKTPSRPVAQREMHPSLVLQRAQADPASLTPGDVKTLQRSVGNQATAQLLSPILQPKLKLGPAGDKYEQEADHVAKQVTGQMDAPVQRTGEEDELQMKPADSIQRVEEEDELQMKPMAQRMGEEDELQMKALHGPEGGEVESTVEQSIQAARGGGRSLDDGVRGSMEGAIGADFSGVRVHTDQKSDALNRSLNARAFTVGSDIFMRSGEYNPGSSGGKELLAHELTHTVQQGAAPTAQRRTFKRR